MYEEYYLNQAKPKGGNLPAFHGSRFQQGYGLGSIFKGLFRWAIPRLQQGAKLLGKKALQTGVQVAQDVLEGDDVDTALAKRSGEVIGELVPQAGSGRKYTKKKKKISAVSWFTSRQENEKQLCWNKAKTTLNFGRKFQRGSLANYKILLTTIFKSFYDHVSSCKEQSTFPSSLNLLPRAELLEAWLALTIG